MTNVIALLLCRNRQASARHGHAQERGGELPPTLAPSYFLAVEESLQFLLQVSRLAVPLGGVERVHGRTVVLPELGDQPGRRALIIERVGIPHERYPLLRRSCGAKPLNHVALDAPCHRADKA